MKNRLGKQLFFTDLSVELVEQNEARQLTQLAKRSGEPTWPAVPSKACYLVIHGCRLSLFACKIHSNEGGEAVPSFPLRECLLPIHSHGRGFAREADAGSKATN